MKPLKVIGIIFLVIIIVLAVFGVDGYLSYNTLKGVDPKTVTSNPIYKVGAQNKNITVMVNVTLPSAGFIPKEIKFTVNAIIDGQLQTKTESAKLGENKTVSLVFQLLTSTVNKLVNGGSIVVSATVKATLEYFGIAIPPASITKDLGSVTLYGV